ncbi:MAG: hypothetical protein LBT16_11100 [Treponema sp.]|nr:hypothetical protein [Treponema sp.]
MKKNGFFMGMLLITVIISLGLTGCFTPPAVVSPGEALDALGSSRANELQYIAGANIVLVLMRTKNGQPDAGATIRNGQPAYTREAVSIPFQTKGVVVQRRSGEDGRLALGVSFEADQSKILWFVQTTTELAPYSNYVLALDESSTENHAVVQYGGAYYWVLYGAGAQLGIIEKFSVNRQTAKGAKIQ